MLFLFKQKTAYEMRISDWSSDVCSSDLVSPTTAQHVRDSLGPGIAVVDGGACPVGLESTVIGLTGVTPTLLRPGGIAAEAVEAVLGEPLGLPQDARVESPGIQLKHYGPRLPGTGRAAWRERVGKVVKI